MNVITTETEAWRIAQSLCAPGETPWIVVGGSAHPRVKERLDAQKVAGLVGVAALAVAAAALPVDDLPSVGAEGERLLCLTSHRLIVVHVSAKSRAFAAPEVRVVGVGNYRPEEVPRLLEGVAEESSFLVATVVFTLREPGAGERLVCMTSEGWRDNLEAAKALAARLRALIPST